MNRIIISISFFILFFNFSCNIFSPNDLNKWYMTGEAWVIEGKKRMWEGKWQKAMECFETALYKDSSLSEAYFYIGKCILRKNNVDLNQVWSEIKLQNDSNDKRIPFLYNPPSGVSLTGPIIPFTLLGKTAVTRIDSVFLERKRIYDAISKSIQLLDIINNNPGKMDGVIKRKQYESDYLIEISAQTVLGIVDINNNKKLDWEDSLNSSDSKERASFRILCQDIKSLDSMRFDSLNSISKDPKDINRHLDTILSYLGRADESYKNFSVDLIRGSKLTNKLDTNMASGIGSMIKEFNVTLHYYYYNDFKDNDGDFWNTDNDGKGEMNRMVWIDWDNDHKIDIFSEEEKSIKGHLHIGDSIHILQNPDLYEIIDSSESDYKRFLYKGPYTHEFVNGDWGVDEEILDGMDNDGDNLIDEDTRIASDSADDDGDNKLDEEWYDGKDNDNDGLIDEDVGDGIPPVGLREFFIGKIRKKRL